MQQEQHTKGNDNNKQHKHQGDEIPPIQRPTVAAICIWIFIFVSVMFWVFLRDQIPVQSEYIKIGVESMFSLALVILVIVQTVLYFRQARAMDAQVSAMQRQIELVDQSTQSAEKNSIYANRAYVTAKIRSVANVAQRLDWFQMKLRIENSGNSPANNLVVVFGCGLKEKPPWERTPEGLLISDSPSPYVTRLGVVAPHDSYQVVHTPQISFDSIEDFRAFQEGKLAFYCWGRIVYEDMFNEKRHTEFSFVQSITYPKGYPCEYGNEVF